MDFYKLLGVSPTATPEEIKKAFREKAKQYHPDVNPEYQEYFKHLVEAYEILMNPEKRKEYDLKRKSIELKKKINTQLQHILHINVGVLRGKDVKKELYISLKEGFNGCYKRINYVRKEICPQCSGSGASEQSILKECPNCKGSGKIKKWLITIPCLKCKAKGYIILNPCEFCGGEGLISKEVEKIISIPAGVQENQILKLEGAGNEVFGGESGDLLVKIKFNKSKDIEIKGKDVYKKVYVPKEKAKAGEYIVVKNIKNENLTIRLREDIKDETILKLKGEGYKNLKGEVGDLLIRVIPI